MGHDSAGSGKPRDALPPYNLLAQSVGKIGQLPRIFLRLMVLRVAEFPQIAHAVSQCIDQQAS